MKNNKIYLVGGSIYSSYLNWIFDMGIVQTYDINEATLGFFAGGDDVSPNLYNQEKGSWTYNNPKRDENELKDYNYFLKKNIPLIGVCRGGQFLTVMNGGLLVQHSRHPSQHEMITNEGSLLVSSDHHQQFLIDSKYTDLQENIDYDLIGWTNKLSPIHLNGNDDDYKFGDDYKEPDVVFYKKNKHLAIQNHPEWMSMTSESTYFHQKLVDKLLISK